MAGQTGRDPNTGKLEEGLEAQSRWMLSNIHAILNAAGCSPADIVKVTLLLADIKDFKAVDLIYSAWLPGLAILSVTQLVREEVQKLLDEGRPTLHELREVLEEHREQLSRLYYAVAKALGMKKDVSYFVKDL